MPREACRAARASRASNIPPRKGIFVMNTRQVLKSRLQPSAPKPAQFTVWHNPLSVSQRVDVWEGEEYIRYQIPPGGEERIPSRHDYAIQRVQCDDDGCRARGGFCSQGHPGVVHGGLAPQLKKRGHEDEFTLARGLDTEEEARREAEIAAAAAADKARRAEVDAFLAQKRADDARAHESKGAKKGS